MASIAADQCRRPAHSPPDDCCSEHCLAILKRINLGIGQILQALPHCLIEWSQKI